MRQITWIVVLAFLLTACSKKHAENAVSYTTSSETEMIPQMESPQGQSTQIQPALPVDQIQNPGINKKKIIKDGRMGLKVTNLEKTKENVDEQVKSHEGYYANESYTNTIVFKGMVRICRILPFYDQNMAGLDHWRYIILCCAEV